MAKQKDEIEEEEKSEEETTPKIKKRKKKNVNKTTKQDGRKKSPERSPNSVKLVPQDEIVDFQEKFDFVKLLAGRTIDTHPFAKNGDFLKEEEQRKKEEQERLDAEYEFADDDSIGPEVSVMILREIKVPPILTRQKTEEFDREPDNNDLSVIINEGNCTEESTLIGGFGLKPPLDADFDNKSHDLSRTSKIQSRSILSMTTTQCEVFCLSQEEKHLFLVSSEGAVYRVPLTILVSTKNYSPYQVTSIPLSGSPTGVLQLGGYLAISTDDELSILSIADWSVALKHRATHREQVLHKYAMTGSRLFGRTSNGGLGELVWWHQQTSFLLFTLDTSGCSFVGKESIVMKGKLMPGITAESRCYSAVNFPKGFILLCLCDDHQYVLMRSFSMRSRASWESNSSKLKSVKEAFSYSIPTDVHTLLSITTPNAPAIRGLALTENGFMLLQWCKKEGTKMDMFTIRASKAAFYSSTNFESLVFPAPKSSQNAVGSRRFVQEGKRSYWQENSPPTKSHYSTQSKAAHAIALQGLKPNQLPSLSPNEIWFTIGDTNYCVEFVTLKPYLRRTIPSPFTEDISTSNLKFSIGKNNLVYSGETSSFKVIRL